MSRTNADLGALGGPRKAQAEFKGNSLVTLELSLGLMGIPVAPKVGLGAGSFGGPVGGYI